jgi:diguanylate cyclase (GGDEF)-like protein/PAS domain S-box-containing protein
VSTQWSTGSADSHPQPTENFVALEALLARTSGAIVAALGSDGSLVPMPGAVPLGSHSALDEDWGLELLVAEDRLKFIEGLARAKSEAIVRLESHLLAAPDQTLTMHIFDVRADVGVHVLVIESPDTEAVLRSVDARAALRPTVGHVKRDALSVFLEVDPATTQILGWTPAELVGHGTVEFVHPEDTQGAVESWIDMRSGKGIGQVRLRYRHASGRYIWVEVTNENFLDDPERGYVLSELVDISGQMEELVALRDRERLLARLAEALPIGILHLHPDGEVVYTNQLLVSLLGQVDSTDTFIRSVVTADQPALEAALTYALGGNFGNLEVGVKHGFGERRCEVTFRTLANDTDRVDGVIVCVSDATDRSRLRAELEHRASYDALSGCLNRMATVTALEQALREVSQVAVAYIDLDRFKGVNDELGHAAGDELLRVTAARLRRAIRADDRLGRIGGDEFVVICPRGECEFEEKELAHRLTEAINGDVMFAKQRIPLRASVGTAVSLAGEFDAEAVLHRADMAMYAVKHQAQGAADAADAAVVVRGPPQ